MVMSAGGGLATTHRIPHQPPANPAERFAMPYSDQDHDRALRRLVNDITHHPDTKQPRRVEAGLGLCFLLLASLLALWLLLAVGCVSTPDPAERRMELYDAGQGLHLAEPRQP